MSSEKDLTLFVRYGSLSQTYQEGYQSTTYHSPPARKGFYAFPYVAQEMFLIGSLNKTQPDSFTKRGEEFASDSDYKKKLRQLRKVFKKDKGFVWHHLEDYAKPNEVTERNKEWIKTSLYDWRKIFMRASINARMPTASDYYTGPKSFNEINGIAGGTSKDHLEVFFEDKI